MNLNLPTGWRIEKLGDVCKTTSGGTPSRKTPQYYNGNIAWIKSGELDKGLILDSEEKITAEAVKNSSAKIFPKGTLLIALYGATIGKLAFLGIDAATNQAICGIFKNVRINQHYLYNYLLFKRSHLIKQGIGGAQPNISQAILKNLDIPLPGLTEQNQIVNKIEELFSELDKGIENLKTAQQQLKVYRQAVLKWAFEGKLTNNDVKYGELPKGWMPSTIGKLFDVFIGSTPSRKEPKYWNGNINWVSSGEVSFCNIISTREKISEYGLANSSCKVHPPGTVIIAMIGEGKTRGQVALLKIEASHNQNTAAIRTTRNNYLPELLYYFLFFRYEANRKIGSGNNQKALNKERVKEITIPLIPINQQYAILQEIESRLSLCDKIEETITDSLQQTEALKQSILKKAFEGKLVKTEILSTYKPKNTYFYQMQLLGIVAAASKENGINHGEMTIAKYAYLLDKVYEIPTYYDYQRWHLGPYPPEIKKAINNTKFFTKINNAIEVKDIDTLRKYTNPYSDKLKSAVNNLSNIFSAYSIKDRSHQIELLATVCKVIEDVQSTDLKIIRKSMTEWKVDLKTTHFKTKAEKFSEEETLNCIKLIVGKGWELKLIS